MNNAAEMALAGGSSLIEQVESQAFEALLVRPEYIFDPEAEHTAPIRIFDGFLSQGDLVVWIGREKHRKTNFILQCAICVALGKDFLNFRFAASNPLRVVVIDYESKAASLKRRYAAICGGMTLGPEDKAQLKENLRIIDVRRSYETGSGFPRFPANNKSDDDKKAEEFWQELRKDNPADLYIIDPMRSMHGEDENDSKIEKLLVRLRHLFGGAALIIAHHMTKAGAGQWELRLKHDMRAWSDGARGSGAIKAHADVIVCQERWIENEREVVSWGAFLRDDADIEPITVVESDPQSFFWETSLDVPDHLLPSYDALSKVGMRFRSQSDAAQVIRRATDKSKATAYRHLTELKNIGLIAPSANGEWVLKPPKVAQALER